MTSDSPAPPIGDRPPPLGEALARIGGLQGIAESSLPAAVFVIVRVAFAESIRTAAIAAVAFAALLALSRLARRQTPMYALSGVVGVAIAGYIASRTGKAENFFLPGLLLNLAYALGFLVSIAIRIPLVGVIVEGATGSGLGWRQNAARVRSYQQASAIWVGVFLTRIAIQLPFYLAGALLALGTARIATGIPLMVIGLWLTWLVLRGDATSRPPAVEPT